MANVTVLLSDITLTTWTVPADWTNSNTIECIGGGAAAAGWSASHFASLGGGGGAYAKSINQSLTPGGLVSINIGAGGNVATLSSQTGPPGGQTWIGNDPTFTAFNPIDQTIGNGGSLTNSNLTYNQTSVSSTTVVRSIAKQATGKFYVEFTVTTKASLTFSGPGICSTGPDLTALNTFEWNVNGTTSVSSIASAAQGDVMCIAWDLVNGQFWGRVNGGNWNNSGTADPTTNAGGLAIGFSGPYQLFISLNANSGSAPAITANFGSSAFAQAVPSGFTSGWSGSNTVISGARGGTGGNGGFSSGFQGVGGSTANSIALGTGNVKTAGGNGGGTGGTSSGGGGTGGPAGAGASGGNGGSGSNGGAAGGGAGDTTAGGNGGANAPGTSVGGAGGNNGSGTGGGVGSTTNGVAGTAGTNGGGGGGGYGGNVSIGGNGGNGSIWGSNFGPGGGGGVGTGATPTTSIGGNGGLWGGGGGGGGEATPSGSQLPGIGAQGAILITYVSNPNVNSFNPTRNMFLLYQQ